MSTSAAGGLTRAPEDPGAVARNVSVGVRLLVSAIVFAFMGFAFAFFYLKAVNANGLWRPAHTNPPQGYGIAILVCVLATAALFEVGRRGLRTPARRAWSVSLGGALGLGVAAVVLGVLQILETNFSAYDGGGYASVFYGYDALFLAVWLGAVYWVETLLATALRRIPNPEMPGADPVELLWPSADAGSVFVLTLAGIAVAFYVMLYLIK